jgi:hypothetical protein
MLSNNAGAYGNLGKNQTGGDWVDKYIETDSLKATTLRVSREYMIRGWDDRPA